MSVAIADLTPFHLGVSQSFVPVRVLSARDSSVAIGGDPPAEFYMQNVRLCLQNQGCLDITPSGELSFSTPVELAIPCLFDSKTRGLEITTFDGNNNRKFYVCNGESTTVRSFGSLDKAKIKGCKHVKIILPDEQIPELLGPALNYAPPKPKSLFERLKNKATNLFGGPSQFDT